MPNTNQVLLTVSGTLTNIFPALHRPGCILEMTNGETMGHYYVPLAPHDCRREFQIGAKATFRVDQSARPGQDGSIPTAGTACRLWDAVTA